MNLYYVRFNDGQYHFVWAHSLTQVGGWAYGYSRMALKAVVTIEQVNHPGPAQPSDVVLK